ncbi:matrilin-2-like isoform X2 [Bacillus rossius redtenbacheri]|uniref:matrilin-2-like isoform X2 n=1 Tax=Bacillus rossius redtenbacheri TaxID=93214 RepID=UPI002FDCAB9F
MRCVLLVVAALAAVCGEAPPRVHPAAPRRGYGGECAHDPDCEAGLACDSNKRCGCRQGQVVSSDQLKCVSAALHGEACNETAQCLAHLEHTECGDHSCGCAPGYRYSNTSDDHSCDPVLKYLEACSSTPECETPFVCSQHLCKCPADHRLSQGNKSCTPVLKYLEACSSTPECEAPFVCSQHLCKCPADHRLSQDNKTCTSALRKYGQACSSPADCEPPFVACTLGTCRCRAEQSVSEDHLACSRGSDPTSAQINAGLVVLACFLSFLLSARPGNLALVPVDSC